jgi:hypothetical protein
VAQQAPRVLDTDLRAMSAPGAPAYVNPLQDELDYYNKSCAPQHKKEKQPSGEGFMLLACHLGRREHEFEKKRVAREGAAAALVAAQLSQARPAAPVVANELMQ